MHRSRALDAFAALSHGARLDLLRALVGVGPEGLSAGEIARRMGMSASRLSFHLASLEQAALVRSRRRGRSVFYAADHAGIEGVIGYLMHDCCAHRGPDGPAPAGTAEDHELAGG
ncbi:MAG: ArsR/SmtB family transcription factor [Pseudomonadota bacterium]